MKNSQLKKLLLDNFQQSSLIVTSFAEIRKMFNVDNNDIDFIGCAKAANFDLFGSSGIWGRKKDK